MKPEVVVQARGGYIAVGNYRFEIEMMAGPTNHCIYFPHRDLDRSLIEARKAVQALIDSEPGKWELHEYDTAHGFYDAMTVNERLYAAGLLDEFDLALELKDKNKLKEILSEVEVSELDIEEITNTA